MYKLFFYYIIVNFSYSPRCPKMKRKLYLFSVLIKENIIIFFWNWRLKLPRQNYHMVKEQEMEKTLIKKKLKLVFYKRDIFLMVVTYFYLQRMLSLPLAVTHWSDVCKELIKGDLSPNLRLGQVWNLLEWVDRIQASIDFQV